MEEKNELNDIILNKGGVSSNNKKIILAVATLGIILIIVIMIMNTLSSSDSENLPQAILPPEPKIAQSSQIEEDPLFEEVEVIQEDALNNDNLDMVAQKLIAESKQQPQETIKSPVVEQVKPQPKQVVTPKPVEKKQTQSKQAQSGSHYIQVGSFSTYEPNAKFLKSITDKGYSYTFHKVSSNGKTLNKVLVGPFKSDKEARDALRTVRSSIESGAFITKI